MPPNPMTPAVHTSPPGVVMKRLIGSLSMFTIVMTIPQVLTIWVGHHASGVSLLSWGAYLISAAVWFWYGLQKRDRNIYLPCVGWIALDGAVLIGALMNR